MQFIFVDSNVFLQCRPLEDLDWNSLCGSGEVTLLVPSAVLAELDTHKSNGNSRRAQRSRRALQFLNSILEAPDDMVVIRDNPSKVLARFAPEVSGDTPKLNDDSILFEVAEMARTRTNEVVALVTLDTNLKVKAKRRGLRFFPVPAEWLLPPEPDERDKRVQQLEEQVALLKKQVPIIKITMEERCEIKLVIPKYEPLSPGTVKRLMDAMTATFPMKTDFSLTASERFIAVGSVGLFPLHPPADRTIAKYQHEEYPEWERSLRKRLEQLHSSLHLRDATAEIRLFVENTGTVPGDHVQIAIRPSEGFLNVEREYHAKLLENQLTRPRVPIPPKPQQVSLDSLGKLHGLSGFPAPHMPNIPVRHKRDEFYLKAGGKVDTEWVWECENMRHGGSPAGFFFKLGVNMQSNPSGGKLVIVVSAENLPKAAEQQFPIRISYVPADSVAAATAWLGLVPTRI